MKHKKTTTHRVNNTSTETENVLVLSDTFRKVSIKIAVLTVQNTKLAWGLQWNSNDAAKSDKQQNYEINSIDVTM